MHISLDTNTNKLRLEFQYRKELVAAIKELPDRQYNPNDHSWLVGFNKYNLSSILAILAGNNFPADQLNRVEAEAMQVLDANPAVIEDSEFQTAILPPIVRIGNLILEAYKDGRIDQKEQVLLLSIVNHLSIKDFVK